MLEVLVALVLVTSVGIAVVLWAQSGLSTVSRVRAEYERLEATRQINDWVRTLPQSGPASGENRVGPWKVRWTRKIQQSSPQTGYPRGVSTFDAVMYRYQYDVFTETSNDTPYLSDEAVILLSRQVRAASSAEVPF